MSNMKHDAIVESGIKIHERIPIPEDMIPDDSRVEIDAKINAGYFTTGKSYTMEELAQVRGRGWEKWEDITVRCLLARKMTMLTILNSINGLYVCIQVGRRSVGECVSFVLLLSVFLAIYSREENAKQKGEIRDHPYKDSIVTIYLSSEVLRGFRLDHP